MKNLKLLYTQIQDRPLTFETYLAYVGPVIPSQCLFKLESYQRDTGFLLQSEDGSYHIWYVGVVTNEQTQLETYHVTETATWPANQLNEAMTDLMLQMRIECEDLITNNGVR